ncbi:alpha/beta fold hydrolase [Streptomyces sp. L7]
MGSIELVTHDIGIMVGYAVAATRPERVSRWVAIDAPLPGIGPWDRITQDPMMWHFGFGGHDMERPRRRPRAHLLDRFWNELSVVPERFDEAKREHSRGALRATRRHAGELRPVPRVHAGRGEPEVPRTGQTPNAGPGLRRWRPPSAGIGEVLRCVADDVEDAVIPDCGHWITEEQPQATTDLVVEFLRRAR